MDCVLKRVGPVAAFIILDHSGTMMVPNAVAAQLMELLEPDSTVQHKSLFQRILGEVRARRGKGGRTAPALDLDEFVGCLQDIVQHRTVIPRKLLAADSPLEHVREALRRVFTGYRPLPPPGAAAADHAAAQASLPPLGHAVCDGQPVALHVDYLCHFSSFSWISFSFSF